MALLCSACIAIPTYPLKPLQLCRLREGVSPKLGARLRSGVCIRAAKLPVGVEAPKDEPKLPAVFCGFTKNAEIWNSRAAMIGIVSIVIVELVLKKGLLEVIGIEVGKGLDLPL
ncbi:hypothetical protein O6H91_17G012300 [Diphasiastrum complanatum]|uniref:Uncharacterized protein n=1 Tax=Diphasiastrum complanatum TaxID=34168 RepID=A0ACC2B468_DIPCM|nr:hypothetical protein O6H91_17G012300 [Diphasiastrum complanatum]